MYKKGCNTDRTLTSTERGKSLLLKQFFNTSYAKARIRTEKIYWVNRIFNSGQNEFYEEN